jgi:RimJ/RimL family protein N-acetyltransferase
MPIRLEPFGPDDIDRLIGWVGSAEFLLQWAGPAWGYPLSREQLQEHLAGAGGQNPGRVIFKAVALDTSECVGHGEVLSIDRRNLSAVLGRILVGPPELRGRGIGEQIVRALLRFGFEELSLHRLALNVADFNVAAIRCCEKCGFVREGTLREARKHGAAYWNVHVMSILVHEWRSA